jgi:hypothetical protein
MRPKYITIQNIFETSNYVLIEPSLVSTKVGPTTCAYFELAPPGGEELIKLLPRLIRIEDFLQQNAVDRANAASISLSAELGNVLGFITCSESPEELSQHMQNILIGNALNEKILWRYFDPTIFFMNACFLKVSQIDALLGPLSQWSGRRKDIWWQISREGDVVDPLYRIDQAWPTDEQWKCLKHTPILHAAVGRYKGESNCGIIDAILLAIEFLDEALNVRKMTDKDDILDYLTLGLSYGKWFFNHRKVAFEWENLSAGHISWAQLVSKFTPDDHANMKMLAKGEKNEQ